MLQSLLRLSLHLWDIKINFLFFHLNYNLLPLGVLIEEIKILSPLRGANNFFRAFEWDGALPLALLEVLGPFFEIRPPVPYSLGFKLPWPTSKSIGRAHESWAHHSHCAGPKLSMLATPACPALGGHAPMSQANARMLNRLEAHLMFGLRPASSSTCISMPPNFDPTIELGLGWTGDRHHVILAGLIQPSDLDRST